MLDHLIFTVILDVIALSIISMITSQNQLIAKKTRDKFVFTFFIVGLISVIEIVILVVNNLDGSYRTINIISNFFGFALSPLVPLIFAYSITDTKLNKYVKLDMLCYVILLVLSIPYGLIYRVDANNVYMRGPLFLIYPLTYTVSVVYYLYLMIKIGRRYQNQNISMILIMAFLFIAGTSIQFIDENIQLSWMAISLLSMLNYIYFNTMWQQLDGLTGLLNQHSYLEAIEHNSRSGIMVFMDVNGFKQINDKYGHSTGNSVLISLSRFILDIYGQYGSCYRVGGDEFVVLLESDVNYIELNHNLEHHINEEREINLYFPSVSIGVAKYHADDNLKEIFVLADHEMYMNKHK